MICKIFPAAISSDMQTNVVNLILYTSVSKKFRNGGCHEQETANIAILKS
jgi:hypothetical protein